MSKAFTKEQEDEPVLGPVYQPPPGGRNLLTRSGHQRLLEELARTDDQRRRAYLQAALDCAEVVDPPQSASDEVQFGMYVEVSDDDGRRHTYQIVGVDEVDTEAGAISWTSPLAQALLGASVGDSICYATPKGEQYLVLEAITMTR